VTSARVAGSLIRGISESLHAADDHGIRVTREPPEPPMVVRNAVRAAAGSFLLTALLLIGIHLILK
jgi:hypothetical protein